MIAEAPSTVTWCTSLNYDTAHLVPPHSHVAMCGAMEPLQGKWFPIDAKDDSTRRCKRCMAHANDEPGAYTEGYQRCLSVLAEMAGGLHHLPKAAPFGRGVMVCWHNGLATFDSDLLTRLVLQAHLHGVRIELRPAGPSIKICVWPSASSDNPKDSYVDRHPTLEGLIVMAEQLQIESQWKTLEGGNEE